MRGKVSLVSLILLYLLKKGIYIYMGIVNITRWGYIPIREKKWILWILEASENRRQEC